MLFEAIESKSPTIIGQNNEKSESQERMIANILVGSVYIYKKHHCIKYKQNQCQHKNESYCQLLSTSWNIFSKGHELKIISDILIFNETLIENDKRNNYVCFCNHVKWVS